MVTDANLCPLCGANNQCAIVVNKSANKCWCQNIEVQPEALVKANTLNKQDQCICRPCATKIRQLSKEIT